MVAHVGLVWQVVQLLVGLYALQGDGAQPGLAFIAIVPAALAIVLCCPSVRPRGDEPALTGQSMWSFLRRLATWPVAFTL